MPIEVLEQRALLAASPFGLASFTPLGNAPVIIAGPGGLGTPQFDLNGDGLGDMIVTYDNDSGAADSTTASVAALLMHADGSATIYHIKGYTIPNSAPLPLINQVIVTDINADSHPDVIVLSNNGAALNTHKTIDLFIGQTDGSFTQSVPTIDAGTSIGSPTMSVFDQNGDGTIDIVLAAGTTFSVYRGNSDGTFAAKVATALPFNKITSVTNSVLTEDLTGDNIPDLVVSGDVPVVGPSTLGLFVFKGQSNGSYTTTPVFSETADNLTLLGLRQLSSDSKFDIVAYSSSASNHTQPASIFVFRNGGNGAFTQSFHSPIFAAGLLNEYSSLTDPKLPLLFQDLNNDGSDDFILVEGPGTTGTVTLHIEKNNGNAGFTEVQSLVFPSVTFGVSPKVVDVDNDGFLDLVVYHYTTNGSTVAATIYFNQGNATFVDPGFTPSPTVGAGTFPALDDFNQDGKLDLYFQGFNTTTQHNVGLVLLNTTGRVFAAAVESNIANGVILSQSRDIPADLLLDYTGDSLPDFIAYSNGGAGDVAQGFSILASSSDGHVAFLTPAATFGNVNVPEAPTPVDINNDGHIDLLFGDAFGLSSINAGGLFVLINGGSAPADTAGATAATARDLGTVASDSSLTEFVNTSVTGDTLDQQDFFKFTLSSSHTIRILAKGEVGLISLLLQDSSENGLAVSLTNPAMINTTLAAGTYYLGVQHTGGADTNYRLDILFPDTSPHLTVLNGFSDVHSGQLTPVDYGTAFKTATDTNLLFTVRNDGQAPLHIGALTLPTGFTFGTDALATTIASGSSDTFTIRMLTDTVGTFSGNISVPSDDPATPFLIPVTGNVIDLPTPVTPLPLITVTQGGTTITSGQVSVVSLGTVAQGGSTPQITFTVANDGTDTLTISGLHLPTGYSLVEGLSPSILPGQSDTFTIKLTSTSTLGDFAGDITFNHNSGGVSSTFSIPVTTHVAIFPPDLTGQIQDVLIGKLSITTGVMAIPGDKVTLKLRIFNNGSGSLQAGTYSAAISASADQTLDGNDTALQTLSLKLPTIAAGAFKDVALTVTLPNDLPAGNIFLLADLDSSHTLTESDETNNVATPTQSLPVVLQAGQVGARSNLKLTLKQKDGILVTFSVTKGTATIAIVDADTGLMDITVSGTGPSVTVTSTPAVKNGPTQIHFRNVTIDASGGSFTATTAQLTGTLSAPTGLKSLTLNAVDGATLNIGTSSDATATATLSLGKVKNTALTSLMNIKSLTAVNWLDDDLVADVITAPSIGTLSIIGDKKTATQGDFQADLTLTGVPVSTLKTFTAAGIVSGSTWAITGAVGTVKAARIIDSTVYVGVNNGVTGLPATLADFNAADTLAAIKSFTLAGIAGSTDSDFINTIIAAPTISAATLRRIATSNSGTPLGLAAHTLGTITSIDATGKTIKRTAGTEGDFILRLV